MSDKILIITFEEQEKRYPFDKDRIVVGRDKACDIRLTGESISRKHAAILAKHGAVYIENVSSTGSLQVDGKPVEYVELRENEEAEIGAYLVRWESSEAQRDGGEAFAPVEDEAQGFGAEEGPAPTEALAAFDPDAPAVEAAPADAGAQPEIYHDAQEEVPVDAQPAFENVAPSGNDDNMAINVGGPGDPEGSDNDGILRVDPSERTHITSQNVSPRLRIVKGEEKGREIKLEGGPGWVIGRSARCNVKIDNDKLSRQHFKIVRMGEKYRLHDMGSANGTRLNGVSVSDAPLQPFDAIQAGPVEVQFLLVDAKMEHFLPAQIETPARQQSGATPAPDHTATAYAPLVPYVPTAAGSGATHLNMKIPNPNGIGGFTTLRAAAGDETPAGLKAKVEQAKVWYMNQPKGRRLMYVGLGALLLAVLASQALSTPDTTDANSRQVASVQAPTPVAKNAAPSTAAPANVDASQVSQEFTLLSPKEKENIESLYIRADRARAAKDWKTAFDSSKQILSKLKKYKDTGAILDEAQSHLNDEQVASISRNLGSVDDAAKENSERVRLLIESGNKALKEGRWDDASESFSKALNLEPNNKEVSEGFMAAQAKNIKAKKAVSPASVVPTEPTSFVDDDAEARQREQEQVDAFKRQFSEAKRYVIDNDYSRAMPLLKDLDRKLVDASDKLEGGRSPASVSREFGAEYRRLQGDTAMALETSNASLEANFRTRLADAEQFTANRNFEEARKVYDEILAQAPEFEKARGDRAKLYTKILVEARTLYQEALIYESIGDVANATEGYTKSRNMLRNVRDTGAMDYYRKADTKLRRLQR